jgi:hypothetical protein
VFGNPAIYRLFRDKAGLVANLELIEAFRLRVLLRRRAIVRSIIERGQAHGDIRRDIDPEIARPPSDVFEHDLGGGPGGQADWRRNAGARSASPSSVSSPASVARSNRHWRTPRRRDPTRPQAGASGVQIREVDRQGIDAHGPGDRRA